MPHTHKVPGSIPGADTLFFFLPNLHVLITLATVSLSRRFFFDSSLVQTELMVHPLKSVSYVADIDGALVIMAHRNPAPSPDAPVKLSCHVLDTSDVRKYA